MKATRNLTFALAALAALAALLTFSSCGEDDNIVEEYPDWQSRNETFFLHLTDSVKTLLAANPQRTDWQRIKTWSKVQSDEGRPEDYIVVNVLEAAPGEETATPAFTDSVSIHYSGRLLPSATQPRGLTFDSSFTEPYSAAQSVPVTFAVGNSTGSSLIDGFSTALQHMRRGDHWLVYIPYQLGYGTTASTSIPAYSTLIFDIRLEDFWH